MQEENAREQIFLLPYEPYFRTICALLAVGPFKYIFIANETDSRPAASHAERVIPQSYFQTNGPNKKTTVGG